jgi:crotonobetainyl-CoA:carnitine CoA-transferase CaiB-like acyl-CoA transferase
MLAEYDHPAFGRVRSIGLPLSMTDHVPAYRAAPSLGADGAELLEEFGFPADWLARQGDGRRNAPHETPPEAADS